MRPHRRDGRLVLEAVPLPTHNCLHAERQDGRLLLTLIKPLVKRDQIMTQAADEGEKGDVISEDERTPGSEQNHQQEKSEAADQEREQLQLNEKAAEAAKGEKQYLVEVKLHKSVMNKLINGIPFRNPNPWSREKKTKADDQMAVAAGGIRLPSGAPTSLVPSTAFNTYECSWKRSTRQLPTAAGLQLSSSPHQNHKKQHLLEKNQLPATFTVNTCKERRRTLIIWDTYCVATT